ncbi:MAG: peptide chain release factor N(5)-glutamine methyltransferase [Clostridiales bacterium]|jgi:release factor glutamine methyltransferase|nr:peptide chain release factor N(5)-glutamine methyltransferase [Clostridiales bacterium]
MSTLRELLQTAREYLSQHEIADASVDAWYLLAHVFGISRTDYYLNCESPVPEEKLKAYMELVEQRGRHIPLQLLTGTQEFMGLEFEVTSDVLIPRQDTEVLVEEVLKVCNNKSVLDMCTGSGCIIISLAKLGHVKLAVGVDISTKALNVAKKNAMKHKVTIDFLQSDLFDQVEGKYDIIVSNPPYIPTREIPKLMLEVRDHEPILALDGEADGLAFYRRITKSAMEYLEDHGYLFLEIGYNQGIKVKELLQNAGFQEIQIIKDLSGLDRVVIGRKS